VIDRDLLRERLARLVRVRRSGGAGHSATAEEAVAGPGGGADPLPAGTTSRIRRWETDRGDRVGVEEYLPGGEWRDAHGAVFVHERLRSQIERPRGHWGRLGMPPSEEADLGALAHLGIEHALFLDLETGGFVGSPVFLAGTMHWNGSDFVMRQYFARHYGEEGALLRAVGEAAREFEFLVTFNGKSYDAPFMASRAVVHGVELRLPPRHLDLLHPARRRWKLDLPDCRLQTLETHICRKRRVGDVPSDEVPWLYHDFVRHGDPYRLIPVFHHNLLDVITMGEILAALCAAGRPATDDA
jgi:uncharacterized protein YprB with RNaseH-like and TPR domain